MSRRASRESQRPSSSRPSSTLFHSNSSSDPSRQPTSSTLVSPGASTEADTSADASLADSNNNKFDTIKRSSLQFFRRTSEKMNNKKRHSRVLSSSGVGDDSAQDGRPPLPSPSLRELHDDGGKEGEHPAESSAYRVEPTVIDANSHSNEDQPPTSSSSAPQPPAKPASSAAAIAPAQNDSTLTSAQEGKTKESAGSDHGATKSGTVMPPNTTSLSKSATANPADTGATLLAPIFTHLDRRLQSQKQSIGPFFLGAAVLAVLTAHLGRRVSGVVASILALVIMSTLAFVLNKRLAVQREDDRFVIEEKVRKALAARGMSHSEIIALLQPPTDQATSPSRHESVEWLNSVLSLVWPLIDRSIFVPFIDLLEDALMQQVPGIVHSARVEDLDQGGIPLRLKGFRVLKDDSPEGFVELGEGQTQEHKEGALMKMWKMARGKSEEEIRDGDAEKAPVQEERSSPEAHLDLGDFINLEVDFAYRAPSTLGKKKRGKANSKGDFDMEPEEVGKEEGNKMHMLLWLGIGLRKIAALSVPVWIEVLGIEGRMRLRLQVTPVLPFVKKVAFTLVGKPKLEISAKPLGSKMVIDAMQLPLISSYVLHSIESVIADFICPKSYTVDLAAILGNGEGPQEPYAVGVIGIVVHQADGLAAADRNGQADPFVQASFSRSARPLFATRVVQKNRHPIWQESGFILVTPEEVRNKECLRLTVLDADRLTIDDPMGKIEIPLDHLIAQSLKRKGRDAQVLFERRTEKLQPLKRGDEAEGLLKFSVAYFPVSAQPGSGKVSTSSPVQDKDAQEDDKLAAACIEKNTSADEPQSGDRKEETDELDKYLTGFDRFVGKLGFPVDQDLLKSRHAQKERVKKLVGMIEGTQELQASPPVPDLPSGIVCYHIHTIDHVEIEKQQKSLSNNKASRGSRHGSALDDPTGENSRIPSSYCFICLNEEPVLRTRTAVLNAHPYFNAGGERFITDWRTCRLDFTVKDARMREADAVVGMVSLKIGDVLQTSGRSTAWYTLTGGIGHGRIKISVLFRSVQVHIPAPLRGYGIGVVEIAAINATLKEGIKASGKDLQVLFETYGGKQDVPATSAIPSKSGAHYRWPLKEAVRIAVRQRYPSLLYLDLVAERRGPGKRPRYGHAVVSLNRIADMVPTTVNVPIFEGEDEEAVEQGLFRVMSNEDELLKSSEVGTVKETPVLEELCTISNRELPEGTLSKHGVTRVGTIEVSLVFFPGIAPEHKALVAGDGEMRVAWETYLAGIDSGERPRPKNLAALRRSMGQTLPRRSGEEEEGRESLEGDLYEPETPFDHEQDAEMMEAEEEHDDEAHQRIMQRQQRGFSQIKTFRTARWLKDNIQDGVAKLKSSGSDPRRKPTGFEKEGVSHF